MTQALEQQETQSANSAAVSSIIPKGRENDYWEMAAPSTHFLDMEIDRSKMYVAPLLITNGSEDRDGEVTNPDGLIDVAFRRDPVVFLQHSHRVAPMVPPVGTAETPERVFDLHRRPDGWYSGCRFTQATKFAGQVFRLVDDGVLRGRSIGALNHQLSNYKPRLPGVMFHNNQIMPVRTRSVSHDKYELIEWSWVWMPANREIVTPMREITPAKEVVPILKGILCRNGLDGMSLDPSLKMVLKSLNLAEPVTNLNHAGKIKHWPFQKSYGDDHVQTPVAVLFSRSHYTLPEARGFLKSAANLGLKSTAIGTEMRNGQTFLKSVQSAYSGPVEEHASNDVPGMILLFAKSTSDDVAAVVATEEAVDVEAPQQPAAKPIAKPAAKPVSTATEMANAASEYSAEVVAQEPEAEDLMIKQPGLRYLKALIRKATQVVDEAEAAIEEQEPELTKKCKEFTSELRSFIGKVAEFQEQRYGKPGPGAEQKPETAELTKSLRADLFYGRKSMLPKPFTKGLNALHEMATTTQQKELTAAMLKGVIGDQFSQKQEDKERAELREKIRQGFIKRMTAGLST
jgi:hypothetical protein